MTTPAASGDEEPVAARSRLAGRRTVALLIGLWVLSACAGSSDSTNGSASDAAPSADRGNEVVLTDDGRPVTMDPDDPTGILADPVAGGSTRVSYEIDVPVLPSLTLDVGVQWNANLLAPESIGDQFWTVSNDVPVSAEQRVLVTLRDTGTDITLGSVEDVFETGSEPFESRRITAGQFDTDRWDDDGDGASNLEELLAGSDPSEPPRLLLFSETREFRHPSIPDALAALEALAAADGFSTERAEDSAGAFTADTLAGYDAVVWVLTSGDVLDADEQAAFEGYIRAGGGFAGIHAASDTEYDWPWYGDLVGAWFDRHPAIQPATQIVEDGAHPSTTHLGETWTRTDEWYDYRRNPRAQVNVLLRLDEGSYAGGGMGEDHPSAWYHAHDGGRAWYTGGGHTPASYAEPAFRAHLLGGLRYAAGRAGSP